MIISSRLFFITLLVIVSFRGKAQLYPDSIKLQQVSVGFNLFPFIYNSSNEFFQQPYAFNAAYKKEFGKNKAVRAGISFNVFYRSLKSYYRVNQHSIMLYSGIERFKVSRSKAWKFYFGIDGVVAYSGSYVHQYNLSYYDKAYLLGIGASPFIGLEYRPTARLSLLTEIAPYAVFGYKRETSNFVLPAIDKEYWGAGIDVYRLLGLSIGYNFFK